jgi:hypothetical protein
MNEWWKEEPFLERVACISTALHQYECNCPIFAYNIPAIIEEVKRREKTMVKDIGRGELFARWFKCSSCDSDEIIEDANFCHHCGLKINWK